MSETKLTIYQKLLEIQKAIMGLGKDKSANSYKYVTGDKVLSEIKPLMNKYNLILKQEIISIENTRQDFKVGKDNRDKSEILTKVMMRFTWIDCETGEKDENLFGANGQNDWEKGLGSALTYAERYFFLKYFHIATDEDDIDNPERKPEPKQEPKPKAEAKPINQELISDYQELIKLMHDSELLSDAEYTAATPKSNWTEETYTKALAGARKRKQERENMLAEAHGLND